MSEQQTIESISSEEIIAKLRHSLECGEDWPTAILKAMAIWSTPEETHRGFHYRYFIAGEAFDWLLLAQRLCLELDDLVPAEELEGLLFSGRFPASFDETRFKDLLGVEKFRGHLNFFYGVTVEEALQHAVEREVHKRHLSNGVQYYDDLSKDAFARIYRDSESNLLKRFREQQGYDDEPSVSFAHSKEFTYWLFNYRMKNSDKARTASDTRKGLEQLQQMNATRLEAHALAAR